MNGAIAKPPATYKPTQLPLANERNLRKIKVKNDIIFEETNVRDPV